MNQAIVSNVVKSQIYGQFGKIAHCQHFTLWNFALCARQKNIYHIASTYVLHFQKWKPLFSSTYAYWLNLNFCEWNLFQKGSILCKRESPFCSRLLGRFGKKVHPFYDTCQAIFLCNVDSTIGTGFLLDSSEIPRIRWGTDWL